METREERISRLSEQLKRCSEILIGNPEDQGKVLDWPKGNLLQQLPIMRESELDKLELFLKELDKAQNKWIFDIWDRLYDDHATKAKNQKWIEQHSLDKKANSE